MIKIDKLDIKKAHEGLVDGDFSAVDLAKACIKNIEEKFFKILLVDRELLLAY